MHKGDAIRAPIEARRRHEFRPFESSPMSPRTCSLDVLRNRDDQAEGERAKADPQRRPHQIGERLIEEDKLTEELVQTGVRVQTSCQTVRDRPLARPRRSA